jgi:DNA-binding GntR family transcriptional regulator
LDDIRCEPSGVTEEVKVNMLAREARNGEGSGSASLTQGAYEALRSFVLSGAIRPGGKIKIRDVGDRLQFSQGAIREALSRLTSEGFVTAVPQKGFRVCEISAAELKDLTSARLHIESLCLQRSIELGDVSWETNLLASYYELARTLERAGDGDEPRMRDAWSQLHRVYHERLVAASDSPVMLRLRHQLYMQAERYRRISVPMQVSRRDTNSEHLEIMEASIGRNIKRATECLSDHLNLTTKILLDSLKLDEKPGEIAATPGRRTGAIRTDEHAALVARLARGARQRKS